MHNKNDIKLCEFLYLPTTRCNCRCKHCSPQVYTGKEVEMTSKKLIEQYEKSYFLQNNTVSVAGGEPFLKDDIDEFIVYLDSHKIPTVISTNGWFTDRIERLINKLEDNKTVRFAISIDGPEKMHDEIRRCKGIYQKAVQSALLLHERGFQVQINMVVQKDNLDYIEEFDCFFKEKGVPVIYIPVVFVGEEEFNLTTEDIKKIFQYVQSPRDRKYLLSKGKWLIQNCHAGRNSWLVDCNGDIYACWGGYYKDNAKEYLMGNLFEKDFDEIFLSDEKEEVCTSVVSNCQGCLLPRDIEREVTDFGYSTEYTLEEISVFKDYISSECNMEEYNCDNNNWNALEKDTLGSFRWTKNLSASVFLKVPENYSKVKVSFFNLREFRENGEKAYISCRIENEVIGKTNCGLGEQVNEFSIEKIELCPGELVKITFDTNMQWVPKILGLSEDNRRLGVAIRSVSIVNK